MSPERHARSARDFPGEITEAMLRETFPQWRIFGHLGAWWAARPGVRKDDGPESLLLRVVTAPDLTSLADRLCLQEWLDSLSPEQLAAVWRDMAAPEPGT